MLLVVGCRGMLGTDLMKLFAGEARGVDVEEMDITSPESVRRTILSLKPEAVINAAACTDVDGCEGNPEAAMRVNGEAVGNLAQACAESGAKLVQVSTDYVFDGTSPLPYTEDAPVNPLSVYGRSKLLGEEAARCAPRHLVVRTQWLYGLHGKNFVETMLRLGREKEELSVVDDQFGSPTWTVDLAAAIRALLLSGCSGIYHAAASGSCSWNGFARAIFEEAGMGVKVLPLETRRLGRPAPRPLYSVLDCGKLSRDAGHTLPPWRSSLRAYLSLRKNR